MLLALGLLACVAAPAAAADGGAASAHGIAPPSHRSKPGVLRIWGHAQAAAWLAAQASGFQQRHPGIRILPQLTGSDVGMAALYTGQADVVLMGRQATESELKAFEWVHRYRPTEVPILGGSLDRSGQAPALVVFVHRDNPLQEISLAQLDGMFGTAREHGWHDGQPLVSAARGADRDLRHWEDLGLGGRWAGRPIRLYAPTAESGTGRFFRERVLANSNRMHWDAITEFADPVRGPDESAREILAALARDPDGLAIANLQFAGPDVKPLALKANDGAPVVATRATLVAGAYALARTVYAYINRPADGQVDPQVRAWLLDVLDRPGRPPADDAGFLALPEPKRREAIGLLAARHPPEQQLQKAGP